MMSVDSVVSALDDPTRMRIMRLLAAMELSVGELVQVLGQSQPRVSRHVGILCSAGLAERRREGSSVFLRQGAATQAPRGIGPVAVQLLEEAEREDEAFGARCAEDRRHLAAVRKKREADAEGYFARHAEEWDGLRKLVDPEGTVEGELLAALKGQSLGHLLDIGTGTGRIAELLEPQADYVVGLDKSPEMLRLARARLQNLPPHKWELVQGDFGALPLDPASFDTVIFHQVLHHALDPLPPLAEAGRVCREGGQLIVVDLASHEREELRKSHAHMRLGFTDEQMLEWMGEAGFEPGAFVTLPGKQLTTKIWSARRMSTASARGERKTRLSRTH